MVRRVVRWAGIGAVVAALVASSAGAAGPKSFNFDFRLPPSGKGAIYEVVLKMQLPPGATVSGNPFAFNLTNSSSLPSNIRSAYVVKSPAPGTWDIFVAINALKATKARRLAGTTTFDTNLQATPIGSGSVSATSSRREACKALAEFVGGLTHAAYVIFVAGSVDEGPEIFKHTEAADRGCPKH